MAIADFEEELTNQTTFSGDVESDAEPVRPGGLVFEIAHEDGEYVAVEPYTGMFGEGDNPIAAVTDLLEGLNALQDVLGEREAVLSQDLANRLEFLRAV